MGGSTRWRSLEWYRAPLYSGPLERREELREPDILQNLARRCNPLDVGDVADCLRMMRRGGGTGRCAGLKIQSFNWLRVLRPTVS